MGKIHFIGKTKSKPFNLQKFVDRYNHILIQRRAGGLGDILMHRMLFEDFKLLCPEIKITFACPKNYHQAVQDHPFIDEIVDHTEVDINEFLVRYDTTTLCGITETKNAPFSSPHRSDIWAEACGIKLTRHNMHLNITGEELQQAKEQINKIKNVDGPTVLFAPISAINSKNLDSIQCYHVIQGVRELGCFLFATHTILPIYNFNDLNVPQLEGKNIRNYMALVAAADYVITVDSAAFHIAGGLSKPQVGIFSWADGKVYGKYYKNWILVQRHRDDNNWDCGPCYNWTVCPKSKDRRKPCVTELSGQEIVEAFKKLL